ncbi:SAM-dependent methyltransferase [Bacillus canaveralius]|uniref:SAM-dependent methyltransferase n=1 Tax=Bacillus canaveralius TaxID=1403243 RepID=A0A2N5GL01_9BACI|nr:class I SAM-dependent methyltransferase [Bacillus canaveralius]PLR82192.1 SAM-dependent methyltransferase [Bacillus canaveralius]PLR97902.1 SAM-dependent methyltransferase [Bacillus canaveralius]
MKSNINEKIKKRYNRISGIYEIMDRMIKEQWRQDLLSQVSGKVLEAGIGTGANLAYYPADIISLTGVDFSKGMLKHADAKLENADFNYPVKLTEADIQELPFPDNTFDSIVSTCVFCSVPDPVQGLKELRRVCKPNGHVYMLEHMRSKNIVAGLAMDLLNPITVRLWGANINRETLDNIKLAGLKMEENEQLMGTIVRKLVLTPYKK